MTKFCHINVFRIREQYRCITGNGFTLNYKLIEECFCWLIFGQIHFSIDDIVPAIVHARFWKGMFSPAIVS